MLGGPVETVQQNLGVPVTGAWDAVTMGALAPYQQGADGPLSMFPSGQPDPATLINLGYYDPVEDMPRAQREYLEGGARPTTFWRDLATASNQVPQWVWIALGAACVGLGYYTLRKPEKRG